MSQIGSSLKPKRAFAWSGLVPVVYIILLMIPLYWLLNTSFKTNQEILGAFTLWPQNFTWDNYRTIFTEPVWRAGYINSITYVVLNTLISLVVALPAAYAFSRYNFLGDKHLILLVAHKSNGPIGGICAALLSVIFIGWAHRYSYCSSHCSYAV